MAGILTQAMIAAALSSTAIVATACEPPKVGETEKVKIADKEFTLKLAIDDAARSKGLGGVTELPELGGILFVFPDSAVRSFWMKGCEIDIDIAFLDPFGIVTAVHTMPKEPPHDKGEPDQSYANRLKKYSSLSHAQFAIEARPGTFKALGIKRGTKIPLDLAKLKAAAK